MTTKIDLTALSNYAMRGDVPMSGSWTSGAHSDSGEVGILVADTGSVDADNIDIEGFELKNFQGRGLLHSQGHALTQFCARSFRRLYAHHNYIGLECDTGEYGTFSDCFANYNHVGIKVGAGNNTFVNCKTVHNDIGIWLTSVENDGHGIFCGHTSNHNTLDLVCDDVVNGETFSGCHFLGGGIQLNNSQDIQICGGSINAAAVTVDATSKLILRNVRIWAGTVFTVAAGGVIDATGNYLFDGSTTTLNGAPWSGNNATGGGGFTAGSYTGALTGCTTAPTVTVNYETDGNMVALKFSGNLSATSNSTAKSVTGMPPALRPTTPVHMPCFTGDNGGGYIAAYAYLDSTGTISFYAGPNGNAWTASGVASIRALSALYLLP